MKKLVLAIIFLLAVNQAASVAYNQNSGTSARAEGELERPWYVSVKVTLFEVWTPIGQAWSFMVDILWLDNPIWGPNDQQSNEDVQTIG